MHVPVLADPSVYTSLAVRGSDPPRPGGPAMGVCMCMRISCIMCMRLCMCMFVCVYTSRVRALHPPRPGELAMHVSEYAHVYVRFVWSVCMNISLYAVFYVRSL